QVTVSDNETIHSGSATGALIATIPINVKAWIGPPDPQGIEYEACDDQTFEAWFKPQGGVTTRQMLLDWTSGDPVPIQDKNSFAPPGHDEPEIGPAVVSSSSFQGGYALAGIDYTRAPWVYDNTVYEGAKANVQIYLDTTNGGVTYDLYCQFRMWMP